MYILHWFICIFLFQNKSDKTQGACQLIANDVKLIYWNVHPHANWVTVVLYRWITDILNGRSFVRTPYRYTQVSNDAQAISHHLSRLNVELANLRLKGKTEVPRDVRNLKSENMTSPGEKSLNIRTNASPKWDRTRCKEELAYSVC